MIKLFTFCITFLLLSSCCFITNAEREANLVNGKRYIPMLKNYIEKDNTIHDELKGTYQFALDSWLKLLEEKNNE